MMNRKIYVASSWRNDEQPEVVARFRKACAAVYDFKNPPDNSGFGWEEVMTYDPKKEEKVRADDYLEALQHPRAVEGFDADMAAMQWADTFVLVLPCGRSAHLELGWAVGAGKETFILLDGEGAGLVTPELMYRMVDGLFTDVDVLVERLTRDVGVKREGIRLHWDHRHVAPSTTVRVGPGDLSVMPGAHGLGVLQDV